MCSLIKPPKHLPRENHIEALDVRAGSVSIDLLPTSVLQMTLL